MNNKGYIIKFLITILEITFWNKEIDCKNSNFNQKHCSMIRYHKIRFIHLIFHLPEGKGTGSVVGWWARDSPGYENAPPGIGE